MKISTKGWAALADVLDHGKVELIDFMGGDHRVTQAARVSLGNFFKETDEGKDAKLINYLMKHRHGTPFEHSVFTFYIKAPIFVAREWMRHRIGSFNEISGRYVKFDPEFYSPKAWRKPDPNNKQGSVPAIFEEDMSYSLGWTNDKAKDAYGWMLEEGVAPELARLALPLNTYTEFVWTVNARSLMNFISLRTGEDAQYEIRCYASELLDSFDVHMPMTREAFAKNGWVAP